MRCRALIAHPRLWLRSLCSPNKGNGWTWSLRLACISLSHLGTVWTLPVTFLAQLPFISTFLQLFLVPLRWRTMSCSEGRASSSQILGCLKRYVNIFSSFSATFRELPTAASCFKMSDLRTAHQPCWQNITIISLRYARSIHTVGDSLLSRLLLPSHRWNNFDPLHYASVMFTQTVRRIKKSFFFLYWSNTFTQQPSELFLSGEKPLMATTQEPDWEMQWL